MSRYETTSYGEPPAPPVDPPVDPPPVDPPVDPPPVDEQPTVDPPPFDEQPPVDPPPFDPPGRDPPIAQGAPLVPTARHLRRSRAPTTCPASSAPRR